MRIILDTNVLIDGFADDFSAQAQLIEAASEGTVTALLSGPVEREYRRILRRLIDDPTYRERIESFFANAESVHGQRADVTIADAEDLKFVQAAIGGQADLIVTNDQDLLELGTINNAIRVVRPQEAWELVKDSTNPSSEWEEWAKGLGIG